MLYTSGLTHANPQTVSLGSLCLDEPCYGTSASAIERTNDSQPKYIRITDFSDFGIPDNHKYMAAESYSDKHMLRENDILFARTGATVGKTYYYDGSIGKAVFAGYCIRFRIDPEKALPKYVYWYTKTSEYTKWVNGIQRPAGQPNINKEEYKSFSLVLPSQKQQSYLISLMDHALIERNKKLLEANRLLINSSQLVLERLGISLSSPPKQLAYAIPTSSISGRFDADYYSPKFSRFRAQIEGTPYPAVTVEEISDRIISGFAAGKQDQADTLPNDKRVPHLRPFSITPEGELSFTTMKYVPKNRLKDEDYCKKNEVLFNNTNSPDLVGKTTVFDSDTLCATSNHMTRITVKEGVNPHYIAAFFNVLLSIGYWKLLCTNFNNQAGINTETLKSVKIPLPPKEIQDDIVTAIMQRRAKANALRKEAEQEWRAVMEQFEKEILGE